MRSLRAPALAATAAIAIAAPALAESTESPFHVSLSTGLGFAYDGVGLRLDLRWRRTGVFFSTGPLGLRHATGDDTGSHQTPVLGSWAAGVRWFLREEAVGPWVSAYAMRSEDRLTSRFIPGRPLERSVHAAVTLGWRWRWSAFFLEASAGPVVHYDRQYLASEPGDPKTANVAWNMGLLWDTAIGGSGLWFLPAVDLGLGFEY